MAQRSAKLDQAPPPASIRRVLVVDDSSTFRRMLTEALTSIAGVQVVGSAATLAIAKRKLTSATAIDLVTLDVDLGDESGLELLTWMNSTGHARPVILVAGSDNTKVRSEVDAIFLGATTMIRKPAGPDAASKLRAGLTRAITMPRRTTPVRVATLARASEPPVADSAARPAPPGAIAAARRELIAVGASTGGPPVLLRFLRELPRGFVVPIVITQHMPALHIGYFTDQLAEQSGRNVKLATHDAPILPGQVLVAPGHRHLTVERRGSELRTVLDDGAEENFCRPAVDPMFRSVARAVGAAAVGVVMTGMGIDGALGAVALRARGAPVVVQDQKSSVVWGMPGAVVGHAAADAVVPADGLAAQVERWTRRSAD